MLEIKHVKRKCTLFCYCYWPLPNVVIQNARMWGMYNLAKAYRSIQNQLPIAESRTVKPAMVTVKIQLNRLFHGPWRDPLGKYIYVRSHLGCEPDPIFILFYKSHKYFKDAKVMQINMILKLSYIWHAKLNKRQNDKDLNQDILHLWSTFGGLSLKGWWVIARTNKWLTHRLTHRGRQRQYPEAKTGLG